MKNYNELLLDDELVVVDQNKGRRSLLPPWIKGFTWIFMFFGGLVPIVLLFGLFGTPIELSLYGIDAYTPYSLAGAIVVLLFAIKGMVAYGLWTEKKWAANLAIYDAILGIVICCTIMFVSLLSAISTDLSFSFNLRLEILLLVPYLRRMSKIKPEWEALEG